MDEIENIDYFVCFKCLRSTVLYVSKCYHIHCEVCLSEELNDITRSSRRKKNNVICLSCNAETSYALISEKYYTNISVYKSVRVLEMQKEAAIKQIKKLKIKLKNYEKLLERVFDFMNNP